MRLTCPNCGAEYQVPDGVIPPGGKHVQCSACHTRWFMHGPLLSEDQILRRLEMRPRLVPIPGAPAEPEEFAWEAPEADKPPEPSEAATQAPPSEAAAQTAPPAEPALLRSAPRLELSANPAEQPPAPRPVRSRFGRGLVVAVLLAGLAVAAYVWRDGLAASVPAAAPALQQYGQAIDAARDWLDRLVAPPK